MDPKVAKKTQDTLGKIIKKPPLTEKLLGKPPFRFLHDIMTSVIKTTGFMKGLYTESEMNSDNVKDRDSKTAFLQKAIDLVSVATGKTLGAKPSKIVAGHEPEKTNEFLQALAAAINAKVDNDECVNRVLNKGSTGKTEEKKSRDRESSADKRSKDEEKKSRDREDKRERSRDRERSKDKGDREKEDRHRDREERHKDKEDRSKDRDERHRETRHKSGRSRHEEESIEAIIQDEENIDSLDIPDDDLIASELEFMDPYNSPNDKLDATYSVERAPREYAEEQGSGRGYGYMEQQRHDLDEEELADMEELRRRQGSRTSRSNRPKAARPRRRNLENSDGNISRENVDRLIDREEMSGSDDSESEKAIIVKKRKSGTKSRLSSRKKSETQADVMPVQEDSVEFIHRRKGHLREIKGTVRGPKTSTPKNSPDAGFIPKKESRMHLGGFHDRSPFNASDVDRRQDRKPEALDSPTELPTGSRRQSIKSQPQRKQSLKDRDLGNGKQSFKDRDLSNGKSPEKGGLSKAMNKTPKSLERRSGHSTGKASDRRKGSLVTEVDEQPRKSGKSMVSHKKLKQVYEDESDREKFAQYNKDTTPKNRRKSQPKRLVDDDRAQKDKTGSEDDYTTSETKYENIVKVERRKSRSKTKMARQQRREEEGKENDAPGNEMVNGEKEPKDAAPQRLQRPSSAKGSRRRMEGSKLSTTVASKSKAPAASVTGKNRYQAPKLAPSVGASSKQLVPNITGKGKQSTPKMSVKFKEPVTVINEETQPKIEHLSENVKNRKESKKLGHDSSDEDTPAPRRERERAPEPSVGDDDLPPQVAAGRLARPSSARPAPPKRKDDPIQNEPAMRLGSGKPQNLIIDDGKDDDDEDETFVVEEPAPPPIEQEQTAMKSRLEEEEDEDEGHGGLVKKIMETKKEYEQTRKTEIERPTISDAQRRKQREAVQREIDKLRTSIQTLTRSANPLGKIMDYVQEDLDSMQKELEKWKLENKEHGLALKREKAITERAVEPLKVQLNEVDQAIKDQLDLIGAVKSNIIRNDLKIEKMLRTIAKS